MTARRLRIQTVPARVAHDALIVASLAACLAGCGAGPARTAGAGSSEASTAAGVQPPDLNEFEDDHHAQKTVDQVCQEILPNLLPLLPEGVRLAVVPLADERGGVTQLGFILSEMLANALGRTGREVTERTNLREILQQRDLNLALLDRGDQVPRFCQSAEAGVLICGRILAGQTRLTVLVSVMDVQGRRIGGSTVENIPVEDYAALLAYVRPSQRTETGQTEVCPLSVDYEIRLLDEPRADQQSSLTSGTTIYSGQRFRILLEASANCYVYILSHDHRYHGNVLFPHEDADMDNQVLGRVLYEIPGPQSWFEADDVTGTDHLYIVASYAKLKDLQSLIRELRQPGGEAGAKAAVDEIEQRVLPLTRPGAAAKGPSTSLKVRSKGIVLKTGLASRRLGCRAAVECLVFRHRAGDRR